MGCLNIIRALTVRFLFAGHGLISVWRLYDMTGDHRFWYLATTLTALALETAITVLKKHGKEWKWFCPSVFIYLLSVVPAIWFLELIELDKRIHFNATDNVQNESESDLHANLGGFLGVPIEIRIPLYLSSDQWIRTLEQLLLLLLILGRWLLPKGQLTHDQLSQLLLVYIGTAADIVEFFEAFKEKEVQQNKILCITILSIWSASLIQFSLVLTATKARRDQSGVLARKPSRIKRCCQPDVYGILISIILQDGPFLALRLLLIFKHHVLSYTNMFFTSKNTLVIVLLMYRLIVVQIHGNDDVPKGNSNLGSIDKSPRITTPVKPVQLKKGRQGLVKKSNPNKHSSLNDVRSYYGLQANAGRNVQGNQPPHTSSLPIQSRNRNRSPNTVGNPITPAHLTPNQTNQNLSKSRQRGRNQMVKSKTSGNINSPV